MGAHRPLLQILLGPVLEPYCGAENVAFAFGSGGTLLSDLCGRFLCWLAFYVAIRGFYATIPPLIRWYYARKYPNAPTSLVPQKLIDNMIEVSHGAFPLYVTVPVLTDLFMSKGWAMACDDVEHCGGWAPTLLGCVAYFMFLEFVIFIDHYYLLHKFDLGKRIGQHAQHHVYKYANQLNAFSGYSFAPQDGWSQGLALALGALVVPVPIAFVYSMEILTGLWTLYIHSDIMPLPWPMMGCDYHYIHHRYNWYNFGFMTVTMDTLFNTVKHPKNKSWNKGDALQLALGEIPMSDSELKRSAALTEAILSSRGAGDALSIMRGEDAGDQREEATQKAHEEAMRQTEATSSQPAAASKGDAATAAADATAGTPTEPSTLDASATPAKDSKGRDFISTAQLAEHFDRADAWVSIHGKVYAISSYLDDHPGGAEVLMDLAGKDGTEQFEDVGHSNEARTTLSTLEVGELPPSERADATTRKNIGGGLGGAMAMLPVLVAAAAAGYFHFF